MNELFPIVCGVLIGLACRAERAPRWRCACWVRLSIACGIAATVFSGEFKISWSFLLIDVPLAFGSALAVTALRKHRLCAALNFFITPMPTEDTRTKIMRF
jgi:hypothetical protein